MNIFSFFKICQMYKVKFPLAPLKIWVSFLEKMTHQYAMYPNTSLLWVSNLCMCVSMSISPCVLYVGRVDFIPKSCYTLLLVLPIVFLSPNNVFHRPFHICTRRSSPFSGVLHHLDTLRCVFQCWRSQFCLLPALPQWGYLYFSPWPHRNRHRVTEP